MRDWIAILILYGLALGFFRLLGGFRAAGEAIRWWGSRNATPQATPGSSSS